MIPSRPGERELTIHRRSKSHLLALAVIATSLAVPLGAPLGALAVATPTALTDTVRGFVDHQIVLAAPGVLANDLAPDPSALAAVLDSGPASGTLVLADDGSLTFDAPTGYIGDVTFTYHVTDGVDASAPVVDHLTMQALPVAVDDYLAAFEDLFIPAAGYSTVLGNDLYGAQETAVLDSTTTHGTLHLYPDGTWDYMPDPDWNSHGPTTTYDTFTYHDEVDGVSSAPATARILVFSLNDVPSYSKGPDVTVGRNAGPQSIPGWATDISVGPPDEQPYQTPSFLVSVDHPELFTVQPAISAGGTLTFTPKQPGYGSAIVTVRVHDTGGVQSDPFFGGQIGFDTSAPQTFAITTTGANDPPTAADISAAGTQPSGAVVQLVGHDPNGDWIGFLIVTPPSHGTLTEIVNPSCNDGGGPLCHPSVGFGPDPDFQGVDTFTYRVIDSFGASADATVTITEGVPVPHATDEALAIGQGETGTVGLEALAWFGNGLTFIVDQQPTHGSVSIGPVMCTGLPAHCAATATFVPLPGALGSDGFTYHASVSGLDSAPASVSIFIGPDAAAPVVGAPHASVVATGAMGSATVHMSITWAASDVGSGVAGFDVQLATNGGSFATIASNTTGLGLVRVLAIGDHYQVRVRARDVVGNVSAWTTGPVMRLSRVQNPAGTAIRYAGAWHTARSSLYSGLTSCYATSRSAAATIRVTGRSIALVAPTGPTRGDVRVWVDGVYAGTFTERTSSTLGRRIVFGRTWSTSAAHTIVIKPAGHGRIDLDAVLVLS